MTSPNKKENPNLRTVFLSPMEKAMTRKFNAPPVLKRRAVVIRTLKPENLDLNFKNVSIRIEQSTTVPTRCATPDNSSISG